MKSLIIRALRAAGLLGFADTCKFWLVRPQAWLRNRRFRKNYPDFPTPPKHLAFEALNHFDWEWYRETGLRHARLFARIILEDAPAATPLEILEWGCGPGRLIRHMPAFLPARQYVLTGADYNAESITWCRQHLPAIEFVNNDLQPPLPFPDNRFHAVYNLSVFTHLSESVQLAWAREIHRVLRPGGLLVCTTHGDAYGHLLSSRAERERYEAGHLVVQGRYQEGKKWYFAIHPEAFVRQCLLSCFSDVRRIATQPGDGLLQDVWVARKAQAL